MSAFFEILCMLFSATAPSTPHEPVVIIVD